MEDVVAMITIGERKKSEEFIKYFKDNNVNVSLGTYGRGTAKAEMLEYLGIGSSEKCVILCFLTLSKSKELLSDMEKRLHMRKIGVGLSFTIPMSAISSKKALKILAGEVQDVEGEGYSMDNEKELIIVISNRGYSEMVMDVAREAGAGGGTVIHARGTGIDSAEKFFGTTIGAEKELIFIVTKSDKRTEIMKNIKEKAGASTNAQSVSFALPVIDTAGFLE